MADLREKRFVLTSGVPGCGACIVESRDGDGATLAQYRGYFNFRQRMWTLYPHYSFAAIKLEKQTLTEREVRDARG